MSIIGAMNISSQGMSAQSTRLGAVANNIANVSTLGYQRLGTTFSTTTGGPTGGVQASVNVPPGQDQPTTATSDVDLQTEISGDVEAQVGFEANAKVFETGADMWQMLMTMMRD